MYVGNWKLFVFAGIAPKTGWQKTSEFYDFGTNKWHAGTFKK